MKRHATATPRQREAEKDRRGFAEGAEASLEKGSLKSSQRIVDKPSERAPGRRGRKAVSLVKSTLAVEKLVEFRREFREYNLSHSPLMTNGPLIVLCG